MLVGGNKAGGEAAHERRGPADCCEHRQAAGAAKSIGNTPKEKRPRTGSRKHDAALDDAVRAALTGLVQSAALMAHRRFPPPWSVDQCGPVGSSFAILGRNFRISGMDSFLTVVGT
jgi:hypothetical protein